MLQNNTKPTPINQTGEVKMYAGYQEEGDTCPEIGCSGKLYYPKSDNCSCHISPPCHSCTSVVLTCKECGWEEDAPEYVYMPVAPGLYMREDKPRPLDNTKIDYRIQMHSGCSQKCVGVYPEGTTATEVKAKVNGTFGGRFESFGNGKFVFIAYTD
jgi:hypothetical protein